mgnify:CR=1 FL=1
MVFPALTFCPLSAYNRCVGALVFIVGLIFGSFANVCIYRLPAGRSVVSPGSRCPRCGKPIPWYDNIPLVSYLLLGARCRFCGGRISFRYFVVELLVGGIFLLLYLKFGLSPRWYVYALFALGLVITGFIDIDTFEIHEVIVLPGIALGLLFSGIVEGMYEGLSRGDGFVNGLLGAAGGAGALLLVGFLGKLVFRKDAMGFGDVELLGMIGAFLGWRSTLLAVFFGSLAGAAVSIALILLKVRTRDEYVPFGPYLACGALIALFLKGNQVLGFFIP